MLCQTCLEAAIHNPSFVECRLGFRVSCAFAVFFLLFRQTGIGKQGRWCQRFAQFRNNRPPRIVEVQELKCKNGLRRHSLPPCGTCTACHVQIGPDCYVGSSILRLHKRQDTRIRKLCQLLLMQPVHAERMLHWQVSRKMFSLVVLPIADMDTQRQSRTLEMTPIQRWSPSLNFPFILKKRISKVGPNYSFATKQLASSYQAPGTRLRRKLRKWLRKLGALSLYNSSRQEPKSPWMILTVLSEKPLASFNLQRMLRSSAFSLQHIYAVHRLSNNLDEPPRSMVQSLLQKILAFKGDSFTVSQRIQRNYLSLVKTSCYFKKGIFDCNVVAAAHLSLSKLMSNRRRMMEEFDWDMPPLCTCQAFEEQRPEAQVVKHPTDESQHVATRLCSLIFLIV